MKKFETENAQLSYKDWNTGETPVFVWAHGWGQNHEFLENLAKSVQSLGSHYLIDFPGFGQSPPPKDVWGTESYADLMAEFIRSQTDQKVIWIGHSFGCRVGLQMAIRHPDLIDGLFLISAAGIPRKRPAIQKLYFKSRIALFKTLKKLIPFGLPEEWLMKKFASSDYKDAGPMRKILVRVVNEDLSPLLEKVRCPVTLVYGSDDTDTPPEIGIRIKNMISGAKMVHLDGFDHYSILSNGAHQVAALLKNFVTDIKTHD